jgi:glycine/D-amino acid oxidase-like deaminating enzyme
MFDNIIVGQGVCGTFLSYYLQKKGCRVLVIDNPDNATASKVASGVINPVTGRRIVRTWMIEDIMPFAVDAYKTLGNDLKTALIRQCNILDFHPTTQMREAFGARVSEESYLSKVIDDEEYKKSFNFHYGVGEISPCWLIEIGELLSHWRKRLETNNSLLETLFDIAELKVDSPDHVSYRGIYAKNIFFCDGANGVGNPYFKLLPYAKNKGEALIVEIDGLSRENIFKQGINIVPWKEDLFWVGSSYEWNYKDVLPSDSFRKKMEAQLNLWLKHPYKIVDHLASERPANVERRPFVGFHPSHNNIGIFNGMGAKGCSLAPYFAHQFAEHIVHKKPIDAAVDVRRFTKTLAR